MTKEKRQKSSPSIATLASSARLRRSSAARAACTSRVSDSARSRCSCSSANFSSVSSLRRSSMSVLKFAPGPVYPQRIEQWPRHVREQRRRGAAPAHDSHGAPQRSRRASPSRRHQSFFQLERSTHRLFVFLEFLVFVSWSSIFHVQIPYLPNYRFLGDCFPSKTWTT